MPSFKHERPVYERYLIKIIKNSFRVSEVPDKVKSGCKEIAGVTEDPESAPKVVICCAESLCG